MLKKIIIITLILFSQISYSNAFNQNKINNFLNNFYSKIDKLTPKLETKIEKLKIIKAKINIVKLKKYDSLSPETKRILNYIEKNLDSKINVYKNMLLGSLEGISDSARKTYFRLKKAGIKIRNCSAGMIVDKYTNKTYFQDDCKKSLEKINETIKNSKNQLKKTGVSIRNCVFGKIYFKFSKNDKYYKECLNQRQKIKQILIQEMIGFNDLNDREKSRYVTRFLYTGLIFRKVGGN